VAARLRSRPSIVERELLVLMGVLKRVCHLRISLFGLGPPMADRDTGQP
jgi:hypothetical protein